MKRLIIIAFAFLFSISSLLAQNMDNPKVQQMRKEFYSENLQFTAEESEGFWPVYEKFQSDEKTLKKNYKANKDIKFMTDAEAEAHIKNMLEFDEKRAALKKEYVNQFLKVLSVRKVAMIEKVERQFKQNLIKRVKNRQGKHGP